jgi:hypothetical protein
MSHYSASFTNLNFIANMGHVIYPGALTQNRVPERATGNDAIVANLDIVRNYNTAKTGEASCLRAGMVRVGEAETKRIFSNYAAVPHADVLTYYNRVLEHNISADAGAATDVDIAFQYAAWPYGDPV